MPNHAHKTVSESERAQELRHDPFLYDLAGAAASRRRHRRSPRLRSGRTDRRFRGIRTRVHQAAVARPTDRALTDAGCSRIFSDKKSGKNAEREELWKALDYLRPGDILVVPSLDRFGRSIQDLIAIVSGLRKRGIGPIQGRSPASTYADAKAWAASSTNTNMPLDPHARGFRQGKRRGQAGVTRVCRAGGVTPPARHVVQILTRDRC
jgi:hypothetical protein